MSTLHLLDEESAADLRTFVARAKRHDPDGAIRLQVVPRGEGGVLAAWVCVLPGVGLMRSGLVLGLRTVALGPVDEALDTVVPLAGLTDRFAHGAITELPVPPSTVEAAWAAISPPLGGWRELGTVAGSALSEVASAGVAEVATGTPEGAGSAAVADLRARVWGRAVEGGSAAGAEPFTIPAGAAFGMAVLGFVPPSPGGQVAVHGQGPWTRLSSRTGFVLAR